MKGAWFAIPFFACAVIALASEGYPPSVTIRSLYGCTNDPAGKLSLLSAQDRTSSLHAWAEKQRNCLDDNISNAIAVAGKHQELRDAIKAFYVKQKSYIDALDTRAEPPAEREKNEAWNRVELEIKLSGIQ